MEGLLKKGVVALSLLLMAGVAGAAGVDAPLVSAKRISLAAGGNHEWAFTGKREWTAGFYAAYNVTPHASLVASSVLAIESKDMRHSVGIRLRLWQGSK